MPARNPITGEANKLIRTFRTPDAWMARNPAPTPTEPIKPPINAWEELDGIPNILVKIFHAMALTNAEMMAIILRYSDATISCPMVFATATPKMKGPENSAMAVIARATRGRMAREEIMVATILLESFTPLRKSNTIANAIRTIKEIGIIPA